MTNLETSRGLSDVQVESALSQVDSPSLVMDASIIESNYRRIINALPIGTIVRYATKCNPDPFVLHTLYRAGASFEAASAEEVRLLAAAGVAPAEVVHTYPYRSVVDLEAASDLGVGRWAVDSESEIEKLAKYVPGASLSIRLAVDDASSHWPLSRKFGVDEATCVDLIGRAAELGLSVSALSFHVGSQVMDPTAWARAIAIVGTVLDDVDEDSRPMVLNLGGGFPVHYAEAVPAIEVIGESIADAVEHLQHPVSLEAEPGRFLVATAGVLVAEVTGVSVRHGRQWVFLDVGAFNGMYEASPAGGDLAYPVAAAGRSGSEHDTPCVLAGPTCDGDDTVGSAVMLPHDISVGDRLHVSNAGAYSTAYATGFCGIPAPAVQAIDSRDSASPVSVGGTDLYRVAWPETDLFERAIELERQWFELSGFVEADGLDGYEPYEAASTFVVVQSPQGDVLSVCRMISSSARGFKTTNDFELSAEGRAAVQSVPSKRILEVGTMATHPAARGLGPTLDVIRGVIDVALRRKATHLLTSLDVGLFEVFTSEPLYMPCSPIGEPKEYYGSLTVPGFGPLAEHQRLLADRSPELHDYLYGSKVARPVTS